MALKAKGFTIKSGRQRAFTIVELIVVITVIGILASLTVLGYGSWRHGVAANQVKSDLLNASAAMESAKSFGSGYPSTLPQSITGTTGTTSWTAGDGSTVTLTSSTTTTFCLDGTISTDTTITYYIASETKDQGALSGTCATRPNAPTLPSAPGSLVATGYSPSQINLSWGAVSGTGITYTLQRATDSGFIYVTTETTQSTRTFSSTGLTVGTTYFYRVRANNSGGSGAWSSVANATTPHGFVVAAQTTPGTGNWAVAMSGDATKMLIVNGASGGYVYDSLDGGATWTKQTALGASTWGLSIISTDGTRFYVQSGTPTLSTLLNPSTTWSSVTTPIHFSAIASSSNGASLAAAYSNTSYIYTSTNSGGAWTQRVGSGNRAWGPIASSSDGMKLVAGANTNTLYTSPDGGVTWVAHAITASGTVIWTSISSSSDGTQLVATGQDSDWADDGIDYVYSSNDSGVTWTARSGAAGQVAASSDGSKVVATGDSGFTGNSYLWYSSNYGATWTQLTSLGYKPWYSVDLSSDGSKIIAGSLSDYVYTGTYQ